MTGNILLSANAIPISRGDFLRLSFWNPSPDNSYDVFCRYQIALKDGSIIDASQQIVVAAGANNQTLAFNLTDGLLLAVTLQTFSTTLQAGQLYASFGIQYGNVNSNEAQLSLIGGYVTSNSPLNYPLGNSVAINQTNPAAMPMDIADPSAGNDFGATFPLVAWCRLVAFRAVLTTDATVANRQLTVTLDDQNGEEMILNANGTQAASLSRKYIGFAGFVPASAPTGVIYIPLPALPYMRGLQISSATANITGGDQFSEIRVKYEMYCAM